MRRRTRELSNHRIGHPLEFLFVIVIGGLFEVLAYYQLFKTAHLTASCNLHFNLWIVSLVSFVYFIMAALFLKRNEAGSWCALGKEIVAAAKA